MTAIRPHTPCCLCQACRTRRGDTLRNRIAAELATRRDLTPADRIAALERGDPLESPLADLPR